MTMQTSLEAEWSSHLLETPFRDEQGTANASALPSVLPARWSETVTPFAELPSDAAGESAAEQAFAEALHELRDEGFDEAVALLAEETEQAVGDRFTSESSVSASERERFGEAYLAPIRFEATQYLRSLEAGLANADVQSLSETQLETLLDSFDPELPAEVTPAGEEFIGKLIKKAKSVVGVVSKVAKVAGKLATPFLGPVLQKLRGLVNPLLKRVLSFAIGRLPAALQPAAKQLAARFTSESYEEEDSEEAPASPSNLTDLELVTESFDAALAEAISAEPSTASEGEYDEAESDYEEDGRQLEALAEARGALIDHLRDSEEGEDLTPVVEQFVPVLLGALKLGINLVGRPKVVSFLAKFVAQLIGKWVGPQLSGPLSNAIVDTGLRLVSLEAENGSELRGDEAAPVAVASVVEDTVRRFAENEEYVFEDESLTQLAAAEALDEAVATHFPQRFVRAALQQAPSLGGVFVARRPRRVRTFRKYNRVPEVEVTTQVADELTTFGGATVGQVLRAGGVPMPFRARVHIYQAAPGSTLPNMLRTDRPKNSRGHAAVRHAHPLTPSAAGLLFREPRLGVAVPSRFLRSRQRIAVGQRFFVLEPIGMATPLAMPLAAMQREEAQVAPSRAWTHVNRSRGHATIGFYLSETDAQSAAEAIRQGKGGLALLQTLKRLLQTQRHPGATAATTTATGLHRRLQAWALPALANWVRSNGDAFARAAAHPDPGVTIRARLSAIPGFDGHGPAHAHRGKPVRKPSVARGTPSIAISVSPGKARK